MARTHLRGLLFNVGLGFTVALLLMLVVIGLGVTQMAQLNSELANVVTVNNLKTRLASRMRDTLRDRSVLMHTIVARVLEELDITTANNQPAVFNVVEAALANNNYEALRQLQQEVIPLQNQLVEALDNMTSLQREANEAALAQTYAAYQATRKLMLVLGILATLLAVMVAVLVGRYLMKQTRQLETERLKYQTLFETNSDAVVILNDKTFTDCNPATLALFGMNSVDEFLQMPIQQLGTTMQANGTTAKDHAMRYIALQAIMRDVSERRAAEAAKEATREAALKMAQSKSEFVANVSHEIRTPMHGILGMSSLLLKTPLDGQQREYTATLKSSALFQARALEKNLQLKLILTDAAPAALLGDPTRIRQILLNLVDNAIKFTQRGEIEL
ncbi:MAG: Multi-sensor Hybrid Histidine Kinase, partial [Proteobacteria bacterium]|nr:Multi-sensor Hybrid Histidine Kinase [Pseudomonadota bacterium]